MSGPATASVGRIQSNKKRPPERRCRAAEGLTTRRRILLMAGSHPMYLCRPTFGNLSYRGGRVDG
jgi:hypothetical protein